MDYRTLIPQPTVLAATGKLPFFAPQSLQDDRIAKAGFSTTTIIAVDTSSDAIPTEGGDDMLKSIITALIGVPYTVLISINSETRPVDFPESLPFPDGPPEYKKFGDILLDSMPLHALLLVSGEPVDKDTKLLFEKRVDQCSGRIDVVYFGPPTRRSARSYFSNIAAVGAGRYVECELPRITRVLGAVINGLVSSGVP